MVGLGPGFGPNKFVSVNVDCRKIIIRAQVRKPEGDRRRLRDVTRDSNRGE